MIYYFPGFHNASHYHHIIITFKEYYFTRRIRETLNKSILAPLRHGFSRRGIDGYAFIKRIPSYYF